MVEAIQTALTQIEAEHDVRVLFAVESGSRAWGFESPDSDYDVRFLYVHKRDWYLSIRERRDVIEAMLPGDLDLSGWDLRKGLGLLAKSNPSHFERLQSPIVYRADETFLVEFRTIAEEYLSLGTLYRHYLSLARGQWDKYLQDDFVARKKYLYVLRPVLACRWIEKGLGAPPTVFADCRVQTLDPGEVSDALDRLLVDKAKNIEMSLAPRDPVLHDFLGSELERLSALPIRGKPRQDDAALDVFFRKWI